MATENLRDGRELRSGGEERNLFLSLSLKKSHFLGLKVRPLVYMTSKCVLYDISVVKGLFLFRGR